jgi:integrase/recombinase XerC
MEITGHSETNLPQTLKEASAKFMADAKARGLREPSLYKYELVLKQLKEFALQKGLHLMASFNVDNLREFRNSWSNKNLSARKKLENLKAFFTFCHDSGWTKQNVAKAIKPPKVEDVQVLPFSATEMRKILEACDTHRQPERAKQLKALVLLMRHSGLRISDACTLHEDKINKGVLELYTAKSGTKVRVPLHPSVLEALKALPTNRGYYFWNGESSARTPVGIWSLTLQQMFKRAGIVGGHSHQLRHTFAVSLLQHGASLENVSLLLGHRKIAVTQKHYAAFTQGRQQHLEQDVKKAWKAS